MEKKIIQIPREVDEVFKLIPTTSRYFVSNKGRALKLVYDKATDTYLERPIAKVPTKNKTGRIYYDIYIHLENSTEKLRCRLSRAIAKTFIDESLGLLYKDDKRVVDHYDNDYENNEVSNLRILTQSENILSALNMGIQVGKPMKSCIAYNVITKEVRRYESTRKLSEDIYNDSNPGRFNANYKYNRTSHAGWKCFLTDEELEAYKAKEEN